MVRAFFRRWTAGTFESNQFTMLEALESRMLMSAVLDADASVSREDGSSDSAVIHVSDTPGDATATPSLSGSSADVTGLSVNLSAEASITL